jgi:hypothetical protein
VGNESRETGNRCEKKIEKQVGAESRKLSNQKAEVKRKAPNHKYGP